MFYYIFPLRVGISTVSKACPERAKRVEGLLVDQRAESLTTLLIYLNY
jgi:hypothetical protein